MEKNNQESKGNGRTLVPVTEVTTAELQVFQIPDISETQLQKLEGNVQAWKRVLISALKLTKPLDWSNQISGDREVPYLEASGAEAVGSIFGISILNEEKEKVTGRDEKGDYYIWVYKGTAFFPLTGKQLITEGICSSRHDLFAKVGGELRPLEDIDETDIMITARRKLYRNAVVELLGLRNVDWEQLSQAGISKDKVQRIERKSKSRESAELTEEVKKQRKAIGDMMRAMFGEEKETCRTELKRITAYTKKDGGEVPGVETLDGMSQRKLEVTYDKVKREYDAWLKKNNKTVNSKQ